MRRISRLIAAIAVLVAAGAAPAQQRRIGCLPEPQPFGISAANQIKGAALHEVLVSKTLVFLRRQDNPPRQTRFKIQFRSDGSASLRCETQRATGGGWQPCRQFNPDDPRAVDRDVATWRIEGDRLIFHRLRFSAEGRDEGQFTVHREKGAIAFQWLAGINYCLPGPVEFE